MQIGRYFVHGTWRTPGPHWTPLRVTPAEPAAAAAVMPLGTAIPRGPAAVPPPPVGPPPPSVAPATVVPVVPPASFPRPTSWPVPVWTFVAFSGVTLGTRVTTSRSTSSPMRRGE